MYHVMKRYQKKLMAVFAVLLMIAFVATLGVRGPTGGRSDGVIGYIGKTPVRQSDMAQAKEEWAMVSQTQLPMMVFFMTIAEQNPMPGRDQMQMNTYQLASAIVADINKQPESFLLLRNEAIANGLGVSADQANEFLVRNHLPAVTGDTDRDRFRIKAIQDLVTVAGQIRYLTSSVKVSQPVWQHAVAREQSVRLNLLDFRVSDYEKSVPAPTTQAIQRQFETYKDVPPGEPTASNTFGFGYQIPNRVKLQYITIPHKQVVDAVISQVRPTASAGEPSNGANDAAYAWEVQAAIYYDAHQNEFKNTPPTTAPATHPSTEPTTHPTTLAATQPATQAVAAATEPASQPAIKPFQEVKRQIIEKLAANDVTEQTRKITDELTALLSSDYRLISQADPAAVRPATTQPASAPATQAVASATTRPASEAMMLAHLEHIRDQIEQKYHVAIQLHDIVNDWQSTAQLASLPGIGRSTTSEEEPFPMYATSFSRPTTTPLMVWQPSLPLTDTEHDTYLFRLTAAEVAHAPPDLAPLAKQVADDCRLVLAYEMAKQAAQKAFDSAKSQGLDQAARNVGQNVTSTPLFPPLRTREVPGYPLLEPSASQDLLAAIRSLMEDATPTDRHPDKLVELPTARRVVVMELAALQLGVPELQAQVITVRLQQQLEMERIALEWFRYDSVIDRTGYKRV